MHIMVHSSIGNVYSITEHFAQSYVVHYYIHGVGGGGGGEGRRFCCGQITWFCYVVGRQRLCLGQETALLCDYIRFIMCLS